MARTKYFLAGYSWTCCDKICISINSSVSGEPVSQTNQLTTRATLDVMWRSCNMYFMCQYTVILCIIMLWLRKLKFLAIGWILGVGWWASTRYQRTRQSINAGSDQTRAFLLHHSHHLLQASSCSYPHSISPDSMQSCRSAILMVNCKRALIKKNRLLTLKLKVGVEDWTLIEEDISTFNDQACLIWLIDMRALSPMCSWPREGSSTIALEGPARHIRWQTSAASPLGCHVFLSLLIDLCHMWWQV